VSRQIWWVQVVDGRPQARIHSCKLYYIHVYVKMNERHLLQGFSVTSSTVNRHIVSRTQTVHNRPPLSPTQKTLNEFKPLWSVAKQLLSFRRINFDTTVNVLICQPVSTSCWGDAGGQKGVEVWREECTQSTPEWRQFSCIFKDHNKQGAGLCQLF